MAISQYEDYSQYMSDPAFKQVYNDWRDALWQVGEDMDDPEVRLDVAVANLTWQGWLGKYKAEHDPHFGKPITVAMQEDVSERCAPIMAEFERTHEMLVLLPNWENRSGSDKACYIDRQGHPRLCGYCSGQIVSRHQKLFIAAARAPMDMQQQAGLSRVAFVDVPPEGDEE